MAKFNSIAFNEASGAIGTIVFLKNGVARARVTGHDPQTSAQLAVRNGFSAASAAWKALTPVHQASWSGTSRQIRLTSAVGKVYRPTGRRLYMSCCQNCRTVGQDFPQASPGLVPGVPGIGGFSAAVTEARSPATGWDITLAGAFDLDDYALVIRATAQLSPDRQVFSPADFRVLTTVASGDPMPSAAELAATYAARFGTPQLGVQIAFEVFQVDPNGFVGPVSRAATLASAPSLAAATQTPDSPALKAA